ncbi:MAG: hypothetical protein GWN39_00205 [Thermoplasmata archaeon]|nr:hypothetical protein [Thermoplasmata archaeon]NIT75353.1 hypothetical protein [Thermoplasmata archaeon]NIU47533.1 hypothetical protein [Thermoplasmata archaeon]NIV77189.1 hypothetical protein [Thermoplasmata archaeon]NIY01724.1 hypothetical protein [Thermoplasmata archaeon]
MIYSLIALGLLLVGCAVAFPVLFEPSYLWERIPSMRARQHILTGKVVTDYETLEQMFETWDRYGEWLRESTREERERKRKAFREWYHRVPEYGGE